MAKRMKLMQHISRNYSNGTRLPCRQVFNYHLQCVFSHHKERLCKSFTPLWNSQNRLFRYWGYSDKLFYTLAPRSTCKRDMKSTTAPFPHPPKKCVTRRKTEGSYVTSHHAGTQDNCTRHVVQASCPFVKLISFACWQLQFQFNLI